MNVRRQQRIQVEDLPLTPTELTLYTVLVAALRSLRISLIKHHGDEADQLRLSSTKSRLELMNDVAAHVENLGDLLATYKDEVDAEDEVVDETEVEAEEEPEKRPIRKQKVRETTQGSVTGKRGPAPSAPSRKRTIRF
jgi:DNA replication initiation complex subunit (GINS family)